MLIGTPPRSGAAATIAADATASPGVLVLLLPGASRDRGAIRERLSRADVQATVVASVTEALQAVGTRRFALCVVDLSDDRAALAAIRVIRGRFPQLTLAAITDPARPETAGEAIQAGVAELLPWPFEPHDVAVLMANVLDAAGVEIGAGAPARDELFAQSPAMRLVMELVRGAAEVRGGVIVCGEPATGRELVARAIHGQRQPDAVHPFIVVDCAAETPPDLERRLFGVAGDGRQGASDKAGVERLSRSGAICQASGGTLYLKNPAHASARTQARLARLLRDGEATVIEQRTTMALDVRPIAAVEPGVDATVEEGRLRADLFERLAQVRIDMPPLRRRREDIPMLAVHLLRQACETQGCAPRTFTRAALALLTALPWRGNAAELRALVDTLVRAVTRPVIQLEDLLNHTSLDGMPARLDAGVTLRDAKARFERDCISAVLVRHHGRVGEAAKALGIQRTNLYRKVRQLNVARSLLSRK